MKYKMEISSTFNHKLYEEKTFLGIKFWHEVYRTHRDKVYSIDEIIDEYQYWIKLEARIKAEKSKYPITKYKEMQCDSR